MTPKELRQKVALARQRCRISFDPVLRHLEVTELSNKRCARLHVLGAPEAYALYMVEYGHKDEVSKSLTASDPLPPWEILAIWEACEALLALRGYTRMPLP